MSRRFLLDAAALRMKPISAARHHFRCAPRAPEAAMYLTPSPRHDAENRPKIIYDSVAAAALLYGRLHVGAHFVDFAMP